MIKDVSKMSDGQLLRELVRRIVRYDKARDHYVGFLQKQLDKAGVDYESKPAWDRLHMKQDDGFCQVREILRIVKKDPYFLWC